MKVLVACESSGRVRDAFRALGHDAMSCDLLPTEAPGPHYQGDVREIINDGFDLLIAHPPCTYLTCSAEWAFGNGPYHQRVKLGTLVGEARREARREAIEFARVFFDAKIKLKAIENPVGCLSSAIRKPDQCIQPHQFGENASKKTCLWLKGLLCLTPTFHVAPRMINGRPRWGNQTDSGQNRLSPGPDRWKERSKTYAGIATAMAEQWGGIPPQAAA